MSDLNQNKRSENLSAEHVTIDDHIILKHINKEINRIVKISNNENKPYYFMTDYLEPKSIRCSTTKNTSLEGKLYTNFRFSLTGDKNDATKDTSEWAVQDTSDQTVQ